MLVKELFNENEDITLENYLHKCGINDVEEYLKAQFIEDDDNYENMNEIVDEIRRWID